MNVEEGGGKRGGMRMGRESKVGEIRQGKGEGKGEDVEEGEKGEKGGVRLWRKVGKV